MSDWGIPIHLIGISDPEFNKGLAAWIPKDPPGQESFFGLDRTQEPVRMNGEPMTPEASRLFDIGAKLESLGLELQNLAHEMNAAVKK